MCIYHKALLFIDTQSKVFCLKIMPQGYLCPKGVLLTFSSQVKIFYQ